MNIRWTFCCCVIFSLAGCSGSGNSELIRQAVNGRGAYDARKIQGGLIISKGKKDVATIHTAAPVLEEWGFANGGNSIVTKSRASHGPATLELWDCATGTMSDKIMAFAVKDRQPSWAADYAE